MVCRASVHRVGGMLPGGECTGLQLDSHSMLVLVQEQVNSRLSALLHSEGPVK